MGNYLVHPRARVPDPVDRGTCTKNQKKGMGRGRRVSWGLGGVKSPGWGSGSRRVFLVKFGGRLHLAPPHQRLSPESQVVTPPPPSSDPKGDIVLPTMDRTSSTVSRSQCVNCQTRITKTTRREVDGALYCVSCSWQVSKLTLMLKQCTTALSMLEEREEKVIMKEEAFRKDRENFISRETKKRRALEHTIVSRLDSVEGVYHMEGKDISIYRNENALICVEKEKRWRQESDQKLQQCTNALAMLKEREGKVTMKEEAFRKDGEFYFKVTTRTMLSP